MGGNELGRNRRSLLHRLCEKDGGNPDPSSDTQWGDHRRAYLNFRRLMGQTGATICEKKIYEAQAERLFREGKPTKAEGLEALFIITQFGLCKPKLGMSPSKQEAWQAKFEETLVEAYGDCDAATGFKRNKHPVVAFPLVPDKVGPEVMSVLFDVQPVGCGQWDTAFNGLLVQYRVARALEDGAISIVPDLPSNPTAEQVAEWEAKDPKEYRWAIIDDEEECLDKVICLLKTTTEYLKARKWHTSLRAIDGKRLYFQNDWIRPNPRYLFFHYVMAQLKLIWRNQQDHASLAPKPMLKAGWWVTRHRYLNPAMLFVVANEIARVAGEEGPNHVALPTPDDDTLRLGEAGLVAIVKMVQAQRCHIEFWGQCWDSDSNLE